MDVVVIANIMDSLYFELIDEDLVLELSPDYDITSSCTQFISPWTKFFIDDRTEIEIALLGYFVGKGMNPKKEIKKVKESVRRQMKSGADRFTVFI